MWKQITKDQIKDYPVGTKVRIDGQETCIRAHGLDVGFYTTDLVYYSDILEEDSYVFSHKDWDRGFTVEVWEEEPLTSLEGTYVDTTDLDEDTCKRLVDTLVSQGYKDNTRGYWRRGFNGRYCLQIDTDDGDVCYFSNVHNKQEVTPAQVFDFASKNAQKTPEHNNVEKLNDLINKYFAKNTTLSLAEFLDGRGVKA